MTVTTVPRESIEFVEVIVALNGVATTTGVTLSVVARDARPVTFTAPTTLNSKIGYLTPVVTEPGTFDVWAKVAASPETPVIYCGQIVRT